MLTTLCRQSPKYGVILWEEYGMLGTSLVESGSLLAHVDLMHILFFVQTLQFIILPRFLI